MPESDWDEAIILDATHLHTFTGGDEDLIEVVLGVFKDNAPGYLETLKTISPGDWKAASHKLKGAARSIGAWRLARAAERAEHMAPPAENAPERLAIIAELDTRLDALMQHLTEKTAYRFPDI